MKSFALVSLCILLFLAPGCLRLHKYTDYFPLRVGREWEYRLESGTVAGGFTVEVAEAKGERYGLRSALSGGVSSLEGVFPFERTDESSAPVSYFVRDNGVYYERVLGDTQLILLPPKILIEGIWPWLGSDQYAQIEELVDVTVQAGHFKDCIRVAYYDRGNEAVAQAWYAAGVGIVKAEVSQPSPSEYELVSTNF
jgi:hypothetical protein